MGLSDRLLLQGLSEAGVAPGAWSGGVHPFFQVHFQQWSRRGYGGAGRGSLMPLSCHSSCGLARAAQQGKPQLQFREEKTEAECGQPDSCPGPAATLDLAFSTTYPVCLCRIGKF
jgi:hypothetical protein